jgi:hypothetical protein
LARVAQQYASVKSLSRDIASSSNRTALSRVSFKSGVSLKVMTQLLGSKIKVERLHVPRRFYVDRRFLAWGKIGFELRDYLLC